MVDLIELSFKRATRRNTPLEKLAMSVGKKLKKFRAGFGTSWEDFSFNGCSSSQSDEDVGKKKIKITFTHKKMIVVKSPGKTKKKMSRRKTLLFQETPLLMIEGSSSRQHSPIKVQEFVQDFDLDFVQGSGAPTYSRTSSRIRCRTS